MLRIVCPIHWPYPKPSGLSFFALLKTTSSAVVLPKAFQTNAKRLFGFFNAPQLTKASFRRCVALKKPLIYMRGFVATIGASLEEFAGDIRSILDAKLKNL
jgi:hypothetical protein